MNPNPYRADRPAPRALRSLMRMSVSASKRLLYLLTHTLRPYEQGPTGPTGISRESPPGTFTEAHLPMCERLATQSADRLAKVEQKATTMLSLVTLLAPLSASAAVFISLYAPTPGGWPWVLVIEIVAFLLLLLASVAALRALAVHEFEDIGVGGVIDQGTVRAHSADFEARGLLYVAAMRDAIADHIADFVRAAQLFLWIGIAAQVAAGAFTLPLTREKPQIVEGTVALSPKTMEALTAAMRERELGRRVDSLALELARVERALDQFRSTGATSKPATQSAGSK